MILLAPDAGLDGVDIPGDQNHLLWFHFSNTQLPFFYRYRKNGPMLIRAGRYF